MIVEKPELNLESFNIKLIITGMAGLVEDEGYTTREVMMLLDVIKNQTFHALMDIQNGKG